jgi:hypothetical protein
LVTHLTKTSNTKLINSVDGGFSTPTVTSEISVNSVHLGSSRKAIVENKFPYAFEFQQAFDIAIFQLERSGKADVIRKKYQH